MQIDPAAMLALNQAHVTQTSSLDPAGMQALIDQAFFVATCEAGGAEAFLLAVDQDADYHSPNFIWFRARYPRFVYVDRVIVAASQRQRGWGRRLYGDLFASAAQAGHTMIACAVNAVPPNPASDAFHAVLGFEPVGTGTLGGGAKTVRYLVCNLAGSAAAD